MKPTREEESKRPDESGFYWYQIEGGNPIILRVYKQGIAHDTDGHIWHVDNLKGTFFGPITLEKMQASERQAESLEVATRLAAKLLELASDTFSNHGCNDFELPNTPENLAFITAMMKEVDKEWEPPQGETIYTQDWMLMDYCAKLLKGATTDVPRRKDD